VHATLPSVIGQHLLRYTLGPPGRWRQYEGDGAVRFWVELEDSVRSIDRKESGQLVCETRKPVIDSDRCQFGAIVQHAVEFVVSLVRIEINGFAYFCEYHPRFMFMKTTYRMSYRHLICFETQLLVFVVCLASLLNLS
jgi:hypothetical protein